MSSQTLAIGEVAPGDLRREKRRTSSDEVPPRPFQPAPEFQAILDLVKRIGNDLDNLSPANISAVRSVREQLAQHFLWDIPVESVRNFVVTGGYPVPVRLYVPSDKQLARGGTLPVVVFFHGGGWTLGSPSYYDSVTRQLARQIPALVLSVDYRLAPENPFPAAVHDADAVVQWVRHNAEEIGGDPARIVLAGDSSGGNLATVAARHARTSEGPPVLMQVLFYPSTNISSFDANSFREYGEDHLLTEKSVESFRAFYLPERSDWTSPDASPLLAEDLGGMPSSLIIGAGCDPLRDEGEAYARKLSERGVTVTYHLEPHLIHAFLNFYNLYADSSPYAEAVLGYAAGMIRKNCTSAVLSPAR
jgi:acetyl esterase